MSVSYKKLFHKLVDMEISNAELAKDAGISLNIVTRLKRNEYVSLESIERICKTLHCSADEILEFCEDREV